MNPLRRFLLLAVTSLLVSAGPAFARFAPPPACRNPFTREQEIAEGNKVAAQVYAQMPVLPDSDPLTRYIQQLGARLASHAPGDPWPYNFHVVASADINAFALPGGSMFVNLGAIQAAETESQLAGVMSHELSHVVLRHSTCNLGRQQRKSLMYGLGEIASGVLLGSGAAGSLAEGAIGLGQNLDFLHMSRQDEEQADLLGTGILYDSGYDPRGLPQFFEIIQAKYGSGGAQMLSDHPNPGNRTQYVMAEIATLPPRSRNVVTSPDFSRAKSLAGSAPSFTAAQIKSGAWKTSGQYASGPGASPVAGSAPGSAAGQQGSRQAGYDANGNGAQIAAQPALLPEAVLLRDAALVPFQGAATAFNYPRSWQTVTDPTTGNVTVAPPGGAGQFGLSYGALVGIAPQSGNGISDASSFTAATSALVAQLSASNGGLSALGQPISLVIGGQAGSAGDYRGHSPIAGSGGAPLEEHDWIVTVARPDGNLSYMVFVAPERDFARLKPTFARMAQSLRATPK